MCLHYLIISACSKLLIKGGYFDASLKSHCALNGNNVNVNLMKMIKGIQDESYAYRRSQMANKCDQML